VVDDPTGSSNTDRKLDTHADPNETFGIWIYRPVRPHVFVGGHRILVVTILRIVHLDHMQRVAAWCSGFLSRILFSPKLQGDRLSHAQRLVLLSLLHTFFFDMYALWNPPFLFHFLDGFSTGSVQKGWTEENNETWLCTSRRTPLQIRASHRREGAERDLVFSVRYCAVVNKVSSNKLHKVWIRFCP